MVYVSTALEPTALGSPDHPAIQGAVAIIIAPEGDPDNSLAHTRDELALEAATYDNPEDFRGMMEAFDADEDDLAAVADLSKEEKAAWYRALWEEIRARKEAAGVEVEWIAHPLIIAATARVGKKGQKLQASTGYCDFRPVHKEPEMSSEASRLYDPSAKPPCCRGT